MLELVDVSVARQGKTVVDRVSLSVAPGEIVALLGANGAGKSELVLGAAGLFPIAAGQLRVDGVEMTNAPPERIRRAGLAAVPEGHHVLTALTVEENLVAAGSQLPRGEVARTLREVLEVFPELAERCPQRAGTLSGGQQQMLAIGHALMARPRYLLIDEMSLGLAPLIVKRLVTVLADLAGRGIGILIVEQFVEVALELASSIHVLRQGRQKLSTTAAALRAEPELLDAAYF